MGIKYLNRFLTEKCKKSSIKKIHFRTLESKTIVIDTSIYLYKFSGEDALLENFYLLISLFRHYNITPVFIFDGKPPAEKKELLIQRRIEKKEAEEKYVELQKKLESCGEVDVSLLKELDQLKKQSTMITFEDIYHVKELMKAYGINHICADGEADVLCAQLAKSKAWACMSDDMDMFVYGCPRILRNLNLENHTITYYDTENILNDLNLLLYEFREIAVLSGTDYYHLKKTFPLTLHATYNYYLKYKKTECEMNFYQWLIKNTNYIDEQDCIHLYKINSMFVVENKGFEEFHNGVYDMDSLQKIMKKEGFIFIA
jgi:flap endonuclease-1